MKHSHPAYRRHDISDETWALLEPHLPGRKGVWGGIAQDNRLFINAVFLRWRDKGIWEGLLEVLIDAPDYEWLMIDASHCKVPPHAAGARGGNQEMSRTKGGSTPNCIWPWMRLVCRSEVLLRTVPPLIAHRLQG
mgnify:CR=1 FL=1